MTVTPIVNSEVEAVFNSHPAPVREGLLELRQLVLETAEDTPGDYAMYFICNTNLVNTFEDMFGDVFTYEPNRALIFNIGGEIPRNELRQCISMALTYHRDKP